MNEELQAALYRVERGQNWIIGLLAAILTALLTKG